MSRPPVTARSNRRAAQVIVTPPLRSRPFAARTTPPRRHEKCVFAGHVYADDGSAPEHPQGRGGGETEADDRASSEAHEDRTRKAGEQSEASEGVSMSWIDQLIRHLEQVTCSGCGEYYDGGDIAAVVTEPSRLIVRVRCRSCVPEGIAILVVGTRPVQVDYILTSRINGVH